MRSLICLVALAAASQAGLVLSPWTTARLAPLGVVSPAVIIKHTNIHRQADPCIPNPCGEGAECSPKHGRAACECKANHHGDPYVRCEVNPCQQAGCGHNAECHIKEHQGHKKAICKCPAGSSGDPFDRCFIDPCLNPGACGANADCTFNRAGEAVCSCPVGYVGNPYETCYITHKETFINPCLKPGACGANADCTFNRAGEAVCSCPVGYVGNPYEDCLITHKETKWYAKATPIATPDAPVDAPAGVHAFQYHAQDELSNYRYGYANPNSARATKGNADAGVESGSYSYVEGTGLTRKVDYQADARGFRVTGDSRLRRG